MSLKTETVNMLKLALAIGVGVAIMVPLVSIVWNKAKGAVGVAQ